VDMSETTDIVMAVSSFCGRRLLQASIRVSSPVGIESATSLVELVSS